MFKGLELVAVMIYNLTIVLATGYVVFYLGFSGWWFALTVLMLFKYTDDEKKTTIK